MSDKIFVPKPPNDYVQCLDIRMLDNDKLYVVL
jgi:hypothetical protein